MLVSPRPESSYPFSELVATGWDVHVISERDGALEREIAALIGAERVHTPRFAGPRPRRVRTAIAVARGVRHRAHVAWRYSRSPSRRKQASRASAFVVGPDLMHFSSIAEWECWRGVIAAVGARPVISLGAEDAVLARLGKHLVLDQPGCGLHVETESLAQMVNGNGRHALTVAVIPPEPDRELLREGRATTWQREKPLRILSIGPLSWTQGYEHALSAVKLLLEQGISCQYRIAGSGDYRDAISFARRQLGLQRAVELVEPGSSHQLRELFRWAGLFISAAVVPPSLKPVLDAHACHVPVITTDRHAQRDSALIVRRRDPAAIRDAVYTLISRPELRQRMAAAARELVMRSASAEDRAELFAQLYRRAISGQYAAGR